MMHLPLTKEAGVKDVAIAALLGLAYGNIARTIPTLAQARINNPNIYDAALAAAVATSLEALKDNGEHEQGILLPGQSPGAVINPPAWNLM